MRIALDATRINIPDGGGRYTNEVVRALCRAFPDHEFLAIGPKPLQTHVYPNLTRIPYPEVDGLPRRLRYALGIGRLLRRHRADLFHNLTNYGIYRAPCPMVTTVHDLLTLKFPHLRSNKAQGWLYRYLLPSLLRRADALVAVSETTRRDLASLYDIQHDVRVTYNGYDDSLFHQDGSCDAAILRRYALQPGYLLFVGYMTPKKNILLILSALRKLKADRGCSPTLALVGKRGHGADEIFRRARDWSLGSQVVELGYVPDEDLGALYRAAAVFLFPSIYEGFGLPVLEAMACGTAILAADSGSLPEVVGTDEYLHPPDDPGIWADKLAKMLDNGDYRARAQAWGVRRAETFSWETCARELMGVYREVLG
ncbi:MAG: glycosyltransferase family 4 protein [Deltaproteobacteria bacterium]|nr:glycosyltransferase family 4 protein [Deltaproteobacteria bacterium]